MYAMRVIGKGETAAQQFCSIMNMPKPPYIKAYDQHNKAQSKVTQVIVEKTMYETAREISIFKGERQAETVQCCVSCDSMWHRRDHSSLNGYVTALSMDTRKCLDVEIMCKNCNASKKNRQENPGNVKQITAVRHQ